MIKIILEYEISVMLNVWKKVEKNLILSRMNKIHTSSVMHEV